MSIVIAILIFSFIVLFHEFGHFLLAKLNGIQVNEFCLGFGPTLIGFTRGGTKYSLKLLPFGGACMMEGEDAESQDPHAFMNKSVWARISVVFAGPFFNFILAFLGAFLLMCFAGYDEPVISGVSEGYAAAEAGLQKGDEIIKINNKRIHFFREVSVYSAMHAGETVEITYERGGKRYQTTLVPTYDEEDQRYYYGVLASARTKGNVLDNAVHAVYEVKYWIVTTLQGLRMLFTGGASLNDLSGPVGIVKGMGDVYEESLANDGYFYVFLNMLNWLVLLSANLGIMNLLPLPALDGGRLVFLIIEAIRRKRVDPEKEGMVHLAGIVLLMLLMVVVMFNDIRKLFI